MKQKLKETALVLKSVLNEKEVLKDLLKIAQNNVFKDEDIPFSYLFKEENSNKLAQKGYSVSSKFVEKFRNVEKNLLKSSGKSLEEYLVENNCELYFPYSRLCGKSVS